MGRGGGGDGGINGDGQELGVVNTPHSVRMKCCAPETCMILFTIGTQKIREKRTGPQVNKQINKVNLK